MILKTIQPKLPLQPYIDSIWIFESDFGVPTTSSRVVVPNGKAKIIIPYKNALFANRQTSSEEREEGKIHFVGLWDESVVISSYTSETGTIGIELTPKGAYRFLRLSLHELTNQIHTFDEVYKKEGENLQNLIAETSDVFSKVECIQQFLLNKLIASDQHNTIVDFVTDAIIKNKGLITIKELEKKTGYSKRYLSLLFNDYIGVSPKTFSAIIRFQEFYKLWAIYPDSEFYKSELYHFYYDQSHFIKEFKRFSGYAPKKYADMDNEFGRIFYKR